MARSELLLVAALLCGGCDLVVGMSGDARPCGYASFVGKPTDLVQADAFSIDWDQRIAVLIVGGVPYEYSLPDKKQSAIDLGVYVDSSLSLAPEGDGLFFTAMIEPPTLMAAALEKSVWHTGQRAPKGTFAGTPSADVFGPRRVLVRVRDGQPTVQEFEDQNGVWVAVGDPHDLPGIAAPNLTPNGLTMVYAVGGDMPGIYQATRPSTSTWFGEPQLVLAGNHLAPQLLGRCSNLYVIDGENLSRYDR
ncbi:MAG: hypothetical protein JO257_22690 [Deltaproteobacteria bacterium]|nr:hypothetical protein [Deltaproteobacteria bacterium]